MKTCMTFCCSKMWKVPKSHLLAQFEDIQSFEINVTFTWISSSEVKKAYKTGFPQALEIMEHLENQGKKFHA